MMQMKFVRENSKILVVETASKGVFLVFLFFGIVFMYASLLSEGLIMFLSAIYSLVMLALGFSILRMKIVVDLGAKSIAIKKGFAFNTYTYSLDELRSIQIRGFMNYGEEGMSYGSFFEFVFQNGERIKSSGFWGSIKNIRSRGEELANILKVPLIDSFQRDMDKEKPMIRKYTRLYLIILFVMFIIGIFIYLL